MYWIYILEILCTIYLIANDSEKAYAEELFNIQHEGRFVSDMSSLVPCYYCSMDESADEFATLCYQDLFSVVCIIYELYTGKKMFNDFTLDQYKRGAFIPQQRSLPLSLYQSMMKVLDSVCSQSKRYTSTQLMQDLLAASVFPSYFDSLYGFLCLFKSISSDKKVALVSSMLKKDTHIMLLLPYIVELYRDPDKNVKLNALQLFDVIATYTDKEAIQLLLDPIQDLYEEYISIKIESENDCTLEKALLNESMHLSLIEHYGRGSYLKHFSQYLVKGVRLPNIEVARVSGDTLFKLLSVLGPILFIKKILYSLFNDLKKSNTEILVEVLVRIGSALGEAFIVKHFVEQLFILLKLEQVKSKNTPKPVILNILRLFEMLIDTLPSPIVYRTFTLETRFFSLLLNPYPSEDVVLQVSSFIVCVAKKVGVHATRSRVYMNIYTNNRSFQ